MASERQEAWSILNELRQVRKTQNTARRQHPYPFEEETSIAARSIIKERKQGE